MKSAVLARASGAARVAGFSIWHLREKGARPFYSETDDDRTATMRAHVIHKNLRLLRVLGIDDRRGRVSAARAWRPTARDAVAAAVGAGHVRAAQSRRGVAEQALAAGAVRRGGGVPARRARAAVGRAVGTRRGSARAGGRRRVERRGAAWRRRPAIADLRRARRERRVDACPATPGRCTSRRPSARRSSASSARPIRERNGPWSAERRRRVAVRACGCHYERRCQPVDVVPRRTSASPR